MKPHEHTQGCTDDMLGPRRNFIPFDDMHDGLRRCSLCGRQAEYPEIHRTVLRDAPDTVTMRCADVHACLKRRPRR